jgi:hypothetical protein
MKGRLPCRWTIDHLPWSAVLLGVNCMSDVPNITSDTWRRLLVFPTEKKEPKNLKAKFTLRHNKHGFICTPMWYCDEFIHIALPIVTSLQVEPLFWHILSWGAHTHCPSQSSDSHLLTNDKIPCGSFLNLEWTIALDNPTWNSPTENEYPLLMTNVLNCHRLVMIHVTYFVNSPDTYIQIIKVHELLCCNPVGLN